MNNIIHHYTSIESLALILSSGNIRFRRLDLLDDKIESLYYGKYNLGKYLYVSCWTSNDLESIPQWHLYTPNMKGVRLSIDHKMFPLKRIASAPEDSLFVDGISDSLFSWDECIGDNYCILPWQIKVYDDEFFFKKIEYLASEAEVERKLSSVIEQPNANSIKIPNIRSLAKYKVSDWSFQNEVRFVLCIIPIHPLLHGRSGTNVQRLSLAAQAFYNTLSMGSLVSVAL